MNLDNVWVTKVGPGEYWVDGWHVVHLAGYWLISRTCKCPQHRARRFPTFSKAKQWIGSQP